MKNFVTMILLGIFMMLWTNPVKADLPPEPWHCASQDNCFAILGNGELYFHRKGVIKGQITTPESGGGIIRYSEGYLLGTWDGWPVGTGDLVWIYHIETGTECSRNVGMLCKEGVIFGQYAYFACPEDHMITRVPLDCSSQSNFGSIFMGPESLSRSATQVLFTSNFDNMVGSFDVSNPAAGERADIGMTNLKKVRYHSGNDLMYFNATDSQPGIFSVGFPVGLTSPVQTLITLPAETSYMSLNDTHIIACSSSAYLIDIANQSYITLSVSSARDNAISHDTVYVTDVGLDIVVRAYDLQGNEKTSYSPIPITNTSMDYIQPHVPATCNNGLIEPGEACDSTDFDGQNCQDLGFGGGELSCNLTCDTIGTINCWVCGDGVKNNNEECDGNDFGTAVCNDYGYASGDLVCNSSCEIETTGCYTCGDGFIEGTEQCEVNNLNGGTCETEGFVDGSLTCGTDCMYETSGCSTCGDDLINGQDVCDGSHVTEACQTLGMGFSGGELACNSTCDGYDTSNCTECGNGIIEAGEECDLSDLDGASCSSLGFGTGTVSCYEDCTYNVQDCSTPPIEACGNSVIDPGEECDDGNRAIGDGCDEECQLEPDQTNCGNNIIEADEQCDGTDLGGITCESLGFMSGAVYCRNNCTLDAATCNYGNYQNTSLNIEPSASPDSGSFDEVQINTYAEITSSRTLDCQSSLEGEDLIFTTSANGYCPVELKYGGNNKAKIGVVFVMIYKPGNSLNDAEPVLRIKKDGNLNIESGAHMRAHLWAYPAITLGSEISEYSEENVSLREEFLSVHPDTGETGRFVLVEMAAGLNEYCSISNPDSCAVIVGGTKEVIDLDNLENSLGKIGRDPKKSGCSVAGESSGNSEIPVFMAFILLILAVRIRRHN